MGRGRLKIHQFNPTIYPRKLWVIKGGSVENIQEAFLEPNGDEIILNFENYNYPAATTLKVRQKGTDLLGVLVWLMSSKIDVQIIAHESVHVASCIFDDTGMTLGFDGGKDEHFAYLVGFAADCINQVVTGRFRD